MKNAFYFIFRSQNISVFVTTFCSCRKNSMIRKIGLSSEFMMSQPAIEIIEKQTQTKKTIAIDILPNIWQSKGNQTM